MDKENENENEKLKMMIKNSCEQHNIQATPTQNANKFQNHYINQMQITTFSAICCCSWFLARMS